MQIQKQNSLQSLTTNGNNVLTVNKTSDGTAQTLLGTSQITAAFNVTISDEGKETQKKSELQKHDVLHEKTAGKATDELNALNVKDQERNDKLQTIDDLQTQLKDQAEKLSDDDKQTIQDEITKLTEETKTPDDKINEINDKISKLTKNIDTMSEDERAITKDRIHEYKEDITTIKDEQKKAYDNWNKLETQSRQEQADQMASDMKMPEETSKEKNSADNAVITVVGKMLTDTDNLSYIDDAVNKDKDNSDTKVDTDSSQQINSDEKKTQNSQDKSESESKTKVADDNVQDKLRTKPADAKIQDEEKSVDQ